MHSNRRPLGTSGRWNASSLVEVHQGAFAGGVWWLAMFHHLLSFRSLASRAVKCKKVWIKAYLGESIYIQVGT